MLGHYRYGSNDAARKSKGRTDIREKLLGLDADHERREKKFRMRSAQTDTKEARKSGTPGGRAAGVREERKA